MAGFGTVIQTILTDIDRGNEHSARVRLAIVDAIQFYRSTRLGFNQRRAIGTAESAVEYITLPTDWIEVDRMRVLNDGHLEKLTEVTSEWLDDHAGRVDWFACPHSFAIEGRQLRLYPIPDKNYELRIAYHYDLAGISLGASDSASNAWTVEAEQLIRLHAKADVLENYIGGEEAMAKATRDMAQARMVLDELKKRANREQSGAGFRPWI
jgi:hypothetical protein